MSTVRAARVTKGIHPTLFRATNYLTRPPNGVLPFGRSLHRDLNDQLVRLMEIGLDLTLLSPEAVGHPSEELIPELIEASSRGYVSSNPVPTENIIAVE